MAESNYHREQSITFGNPESKKRILLLHGYTGDVTDFGNLGEELAKKGDYFVYIPLMPGHGTKIEDLEPLELSFFLNSVKEHYHFLAKEGRVVIGGHSFGGQLAIILVGELGKDTITGLFTTVVPFVIRFPFSTFLFRSVFTRGRYWKKRLSLREVRERAGALYYDKMPGKGIRLVKEANLCIEKSLPAITAPMLHFFSLHDRLAHQASAQALTKKAVNAKTTTKVFKNGHHSIYFSEEKEVLVKEICDFVDRCFAET